jgi:tetratricopeptide (TPR) repeat protein
MGGKRDKRPGIIWEGDFPAKHSLALVNREIASALIERDSLELGLMSHAEAGSAAPSALADRFGYRPETVSVHVRHSWPPDFRRPDCGSFVVMQPWEFGSLPREWVEGIAQGVDEVWVPSSFVRKEYVESGVPEDKVKVVPNGVNPRLFNPEAEPRNPGTEKSFKFLFVGGTIPRKGIDVLLSAYSAEFCAQDDVCLVIKDFGAQSFYKGQGARSQVLDLMVQPEAPSVLYLDADVEDEELPGLYRACDCLVHPYRGEGFGLPIAEAMACGLPVIVTGFGACLDFCSEDNAYLIPYTVQRFSEKKVGNLETVDFPYWAEADEAALRQLMRRVYENRQEARAKGEAASRHILENFTWEKTAQAIEERVLALEAQQHAASQAADHRRVGLQAAHEKRWSEAAVHLEKALAAKDDDIDAMNALALAYDALGDGKSARSILGRAITVAPDFAPTYANLAVLLAKEGRVLEAAQEACRAVELDPSDAESIRAAEHIRALLRTIRPAKKKGKKRHASGPTQAQLDSCLARINSVLKKANARASEQSGPRISVCMIVRDEEECLETCLKSIRGAADEIVVVDTGSQDRSVQIAKAQGAAVYSFEWTDSYADARNEALRHATGDWILVLDADERLDEASGEAIRRETADPRCDAYELLFRNYMSEGPNPEVIVHRNCRLFRNQAEYRYMGRVHERILPSIVESRGRVGRLDAVVHHHGYRPDMMERHGKHERYIRLLNLELADRPDDPFCLYNLGAAYYTAGDSEKALVYLKEASGRVRPEDEFAPLTFSRLADALLRLGNADEALSALENAGQMGIRHPELSLCKGNCLLLLERPKEAISEFEAAAKMGQDSEWIGDTGACGHKADYGIASAYLALGNYDRAVEICEKVIEAKPDYPEAHDLLAAAYFRFGRPDKAEKHLMRLVRLKPNDPKAALRLADLHYSQRRYLEAKARYMSLLESGKDSPELRLRIGACMNSLGEHAAAEEQFVKAIDLDGSCLDAHIELGRLCVSQGRLADGLDCFVRAVDIDPMCANAYFHAGDALYSAGRFADAVGVYESALSYNSRNAPGFLALGNCYYRIGAYDAATMAFRQALALRPDYPEAENNLSLAEAALELPKAA